MEDLFFKNSHNQIWPCSCKKPGKWKKGKSRNFLARVERTFHRETQELLDANVKHAGFSQRYCPSSSIRSTRSHHSGVRCGCTISSAEADGDFTWYHRRPRYGSLLSIVRQVSLPPYIERLSIVLITAAAMKLNAMDPAGRVLMKPHVPNPLGTINIWFSSKLKLNLQLTRELCP